MTAPGPSGSCPKCGSTTLQASLLTRASVPKTLASEYFAAMPQGAQHADTIQQYACSKCGTKWIPRTTQERQMRARSGQLGSEAMRAAQAQAVAAALAARSKHGRFAKVPARTWVIGVVMVIVILLALLT